MDEVEDQAPEEAPEVPAEEPAPVEAPAPEPEVEEEVPQLPVGQPGSAVKWTTSRGDHNSGISMGLAGENSLIIAKDAAAGEEQPVILMDLARVRRG